MMKFMKHVVIGLVMLGALVVSWPGSQTIAQENSVAVQSQGKEADQGWMGRYEQQKARMEQGNVDLIWIGDSITHFWEGAGSGVWNKYYGDRNAMNFGISGDRTEHVLWRLDHSPLDKISPKMAIIMIGTNNVGAKSSTPEETVLGIEAIVDRVKAAWPNAKILLLEVFPRDNKADGALRQAVNKINEGLQPVYAGGKVANVELFSLADQYLTEDGTLPGDLLPDFLHPNEVGYEIWAKAVEPKVAEVLGDANRNSAAVQSQGREGDQWWMDRYEQQKARMEQGNVDLIWIGDSIIHGWEGSGAGVWEKYYGNRNAMNFGIGGDQTQQVLWRLDHSPLDKISPKMAIIMIGTNNMGAKSSTPAETALGIKAIVDRVKAAWPNAKVLLLEVFPRDNEANGELRQAVNKVNEELQPIYAGGKVANVELYSLADLFLTKDGTLPKELMPDFLHPNEVGYEIWASAVEPMVSDALGETCAEATPEQRGDAWWMDRFNLKNEELKAGNVDILMVGDSITHNWEGPGAEQWKEFYGDKKAVNLGIGGDRTQQVLWRLEHYDWSNVHPKLAVVLIGINNWNVSTARDIAKGNRTIVQYLHEQFPEMKIIVLNVFPIGAPDEGMKRDKVNEINAELALWLRDLSYVQRVDINHLWLDENGIIPKALMDDYVHPTPAGYELWGNEIAPYIQQAL